jgi:hypothetical protein
MQERQRAQELATAESLKQLRDYALPRLGAIADRGLRDGAIERRVGAGLDEMGVRARGTLSRDARRARDIWNRR